MNRVNRVSKEHIGTTIIFHGFEVKVVADGAEVEHGDICEKCSLEGFMCTTYVLNDIDCDLYGFHFEEADK